MNVENNHSWFNLSFWEATSKNLKMVLFFFFLTGIVFLCWKGIYGEGKAGDFLQRYYMGALVQRGLDPADFANKKIPVALQTVVPPSFTPHHIDFPWTQSFSLLFSFFPPAVSVRIFYALQLCCLLFCMIVSWRYLSEKIERQFAAVIVSILYLTLYVRTDFNVGNTGLLALTGMFLLYEGWRRKINWLEAIGLTLLCLKPQTGFLFVILLLLKKHFSSLIYTGVFCLFLSLPEMVYLQKIPWNFLSQMFSTGNQFITEPQICGLFGVFYQPSQQTLIMGCNAIVSIAVFCFYLYRYPAKDPMLNLLPAAICTIFWSYSRIYHFLFLIIPLLCLVKLMKENNDERISKIIILLLILLWLPVMQHFSTYIFLFKYLVSICSLFFIGYFNESCNKMRDIPIK